MADLENALKKLDRLTQEEARMAHAEVVRITHSIRNEIKVVDGKVEEVGNKVQCVDEKVQVVIDGVRGLSSQLDTLQITIHSDGKQAKVAAKEIVDKVTDVGDKVEGVGDKVEGVGDKVQCINEKVQVVIDGARGMSSQFLNHSDVYSSDGKNAIVAVKEATSIIQQTSN